jgi:hypothetical protein
MTKREIILIGVIVLFLVGGIVLWFWPSTPKPMAQEQEQTQKSSPPVPPPPSSEPKPQIPVDDGSPITLKTMSVDKATMLYVLRSMKDHEYDWKRPMNFYGKVIDENNQPVGGAHVHYEWTTIGTPGNGAEADALSDGDGLFSLTGQHGKGLGVRVEKDGYYTVDGGLGDLNFEYANPSSPYWYEPDSNSPVIFHLHKKGEGTTLVSKIVEIPNHNHYAQAQINLMTGFIRPDGNLTITYDTSKFLPGAQPFPWTFTLSMSEGGLIETNDQFPFEAPTSGYIPSITISEDNLERGIWQGGVRKTYYFYLPGTNTYGRMTVEASASLAIEFNYVYNPAPGERYLEPAAK